MLNSVLPDSGNTRSTCRSRIFVVIVTYNIGPAIHRCLDSVQHQVDHVVIIDNGSDDFTRQELGKAAASDSVTVLFNERNQGIGHAFNQAIAWGRGKGFQWMLTLDHDSEATPGMVDKLLSTYAMLAGKGIENVGVVGANPFDQNVHRFVQYHPRVGGGLPLEDEEVMSSGNLIPLSVFDVIGPFNEDLFLYYVDSDFCIRLLRSGFRIFVCPEAVLLHREGSRERQRFMWIHAEYNHYGKTARYYLTRNAIYIFKKHPVSFSDFWWMVRRNCNEHAKIVLFDRERFPILLYSLKGLIDGLRGKWGPLNPAKSICHVRGQRNLS